MVEDMYNSSYSCYFNGNDILFNIVWQFNKITYINVDHNMTYFVPYNL